MGVYLILLETDKIVEISNLLRTKLPVGRQYDLGDNEVTVATN